MVRNAERTAHVVAVTSGKGGVGKSNIAANLAICLATSGKEVVLIDADLGLANIDILLGIKTRRTLAQVVTGRYRLEEIIQTGPAGIRLICGASGLTQIADLNEFQRQRLIQQITTLEHQCDVIIVDTGAGISGEVLSFCGMADHTLIVATAEPTSITDAYAMIKSINENYGGVKTSLLINMAESRAQAKNVYQRIARVAKKFLSVVVYDAGYVLRDERLGEAVQQRKPVVLAYPRSQVSYCFLALARKLNHMADTEVIGEDGFFRKVANWFF